MGINLIGPPLGIQALVPLTKRGTSILKIGSTAAPSGHFPPVYTTSKWGVRGLMRLANWRFAP